MTNSEHNYTYQAYGLYLRSNYLIPYLVQVAEELEANSIGHLNRPVQVNLIGQQSWFSLPADWRNLYQSPSQTFWNCPFLEVWQHETGLHLRHSNNSGEKVTRESVDFSMSCIGETIDISWTPAMPFQDIVAYLLGPVLGCILRLRGVTCLHAAVVAIEQKAIAIIGSKGAGKSTTAAFFVQQGYKFLTDDIAPLVHCDGQFWVQPGYPCLRLWPNTIDALCSSPVDNLSTVLSFAQKRYFSLALTDEEVAWGKFQPKPLSLAAIYVLERFNDNALPSLLPLPRAMGLVAMIRNTYADYVLDETGRSDDFRLLGQLVNGIPVKQVRRQDSLENLSKLYKTILEDVNSKE